YLEALESLAAAARVGGDLRGAERHLRRAMAVDPLRESVQRALLEALAASGNYAAVIQSYRELRERLHRELNAEPDPETKALFQQLRSEARGKALLGAGGSILAARRGSALGEKKREPPGRVARPGLGERWHPATTAHRVPARAERGEGA